MTFDIDKSSVENPKVSVIVPMYNVGDDLEEALQSLVNQTLKDIQVILIDDGSTDGKTEEIAKQFAETYPNFEYHRIPNGGLGHARNYGVQFARGIWLHFMDSDDVIEPFSYEEMVALGEKHETDIVIGDVARFTTTRVYDSGLHRRAFRNMQEVTHILDNPDLLYDTIACDKLFRRNFYNKHSIHWVENRMYEDISVVIPTLFKANKVAFLNKVFYWWRARDGASKSITQKRAEIKNFRDRMEAIKEVDAFFDTEVTNEDITIQKDVKLLYLDLKLYIDVLPMGDEAFQDEVIETVATYLERIHPEAYSYIRAIDRVKYHFVKLRDKTTLFEVLEYARDGYDTLPVSERRGRYYGRFPFPGLQASECDLTRELTENGLTTEVHAAKFEAPAALEASTANDSFEGRSSLLVDITAIVEEISQKKVNLMAKLCDAKGKTMGSELNITMQPTKRLFTIISNKRIHKRLVKYHPKRFYRLRLSIDELCKLPEGEYQISLEYSDGALSCNPKILSTRASTAAELPAPMRFGNTLLKLSYDANWRLIIAVEHNRAIVDSLTTENNMLQLQLNSGDKIVLPLDSKLFETLKTLPEIAFVGNARYLLWHDFTTTTANVNEADETNNPQLLRMCSDKTTQIEAELIPVGVILQDCKLNVSTLNLTLKLPVADLGTKLTLIVKGARYGASAKIACVPSPAQDYPELYSCSLDLLDESVVGTLREDRYELTCVCELDSGLTTTLPVYARDNHTLIGMSPYFNNYAYELSAPEYRCELNVVRRLKFYETGRLRLEFFERVIYPLLRKLPLDKHLVVYESYWGESCSCNPKALYNYIENNKLPYKAVWSVTDPRVPVDGSAKRVVMGTLPYFYAMARAKYLINNANFMDAYIKRPGQIEVQTMHGTPLKKMGLDVPDELPTQTEIDLFLKRCARWDYLIVQGPKVEDIAKSCYRYNKAFLRCGYPRNDELMRLNTPEKQRELKQRLGLDPHKQFVLYAPTWRSLRRFDLELDFRELSQRLDENYCFGLRRHYMALPGFINQDALGNAIDFTYYPVLDDLLLAADIVITDYSSVMFDYALLSRPMLFFTYDLESYRDDLRGFYFDFEDEAPGPIVRSTEEVADALIKLQHDSHVYDERYERFKAMYLTYESEHSSEDVFKQVFR